MNRPQNKKRCGGCGHFLKMRHHDSRGFEFAICGMDYRTNSNCSCSKWIPKKYTKEDRRKMKMEAA